MEKQLDSNIGNVVSKCLQWRPTWAKNKIKKKKNNCAQLECDGKLQSLYLELAGLREIYEIYLSHMTFL